MSHHRRRPLWPLLLLAVAWALAHATPAASEPRFTSRFPGVPRWVAGIAFDPKLNGFWTYGGVGDSLVPGGRTLLGDMWFYSVDEDRWEQVLPINTGPGGRRAHAMDFDPVRREIYLFGGSGERPCFGDLWSFSLEDRRWTDLLPPPDPIPRVRNQTPLIYDPVNDAQWVFFGACDGNFSEVDFVRFDMQGRFWESFLPPSLLEGGPWPRTAHLAAYDPRRGRIYLYGGFTPLAGPREEDVHNLTVVWEFDPRTNEWEPLTDGRDRMMQRWLAGGYDTVSDLLLAYGGVVGFSGPEVHVSSELAAFDPNLRSWSVLPGTETDLTRRQWHVGDYCPCTGDLFVFGGVRAEVVRDIKTDRDSMAFFVPVETPARFRWDGSPAGQRRQSQTRWGTLSFPDGTTPESFVPGTLRFMDCEFGTDLDAPVRTQRIGPDRWHLRFDSLSPEFHSALERDRLILTGRPTGEPVNFLARIRPEHVAGGNRRGEMRPTAEGSTSEAPFLEVFPKGKSWLIRYGGDRPEAAELTIVDVRGRRQLRVDAPFSSGDAGAATFRWNGRDESGRRLPAGIYFISVRDGEREKAKKLFLF